MKISRCAQGRLARTSFELSLVLFQYVLLLFGVPLPYTLVYLEGILEAREGGLSTHKP
jgi:hypothetical protein